MKSFVVHNQLLTAANSVVVRLKVTNLRYSAVSSSKFVVGHADHVDFDEYCPSGSIGTLLIVWESSEWVEIAPQMWQSFR